jgi:hypothetical protein
VHHDSAATRRPISVAGNRSTCKLQLLKHKFGPRPADNSTKHTREVSQQ